MKMAAAPIDVEEAAVDLAVALLDDATIDVSVGVPPQWTPTSSTHVQVRSDGVPLSAHPVYFPTVAFTVRAATTHEAKRVAALLLGLLLGADPNEDIRNIVHLNGPVADRDPQTNAELAAFTVRATTRAVQITAGS